MMTSSNKNIFRVTGPLWGETTGHWWIPLTKSSDSEPWCIRWSAPERTVQQTIETPAIWYAIALIITSLKGSSFVVFCCFLKPANVTYAVRVGLFHSLTLEQSITWRANIFTLKEQQHYMILELHWSLHGWQPHLEESKCGGNMFKTHCQISLSWTDVLFWFKCYWFFSQVSLSQHVSIGSDNGLALYVSDEMVA